MIVSPAILAHFLSSSLRSFMWQQHVYLKRFMMTVAPNSRNAEILHLSFDEQLSFLFFYRVSS